MKVNDVVADGGGGDDDARPVVQAAVAAGKDVVEEPPGPVTPQQDLSWELPACVTELSKRISSVEARQAEAASPLFVRAELGARIGGSMQALGDSLLMYIRSLGVYDVICLSLMLRLVRSRGRVAMASMITFLRDASRLPRAMLRQLLPSTAKLLRALLHGLEAAE